MNRNDEVFISLMGSEYEIRPVSAKSTLMAKSESRRLSGEYGADEAYDLLIFGACMIAEGLFSDGERVFSSGEEALERLTLEEILYAASGYALPETYEGLANMNGQAKKSGDIDASIDLNLEPAFQPFHGETPISSIADMDVTENSWTQIPGESVQKAIMRYTLPEGFYDQRESSDNTDKNVSYTPVKHGTEIPPLYKTATGSGGSAVSAEQAELDAMPDIRRITRRTDMRNISDFFERDCRSYDGAFVKY